MSHTQILCSYYSVTVNGKEHKGNSILPKTQHCFDLTRLLDIIWWYPYPITESATIAGMVRSISPKGATAFIDTNTRSGLLLQRESRYIYRWCERG
jgi:hypothetical protein